MEELESQVLLMAQTVREQLADALTAISGDDPQGAEAVIERDDVVDSARSALEERCYGLLRQGSSVLEERRIRSALRIIYNLERVGDAASHIAKHCLMLRSEGDQVLPLSLDDMSQIALSGVDEGVRAFIENDLDLAEQACQREPELDAIYIQRIEQVARWIDEGAIQGRTTLHLLAVLKYLEKVCDFVLNMGETAVYSLTGTRLSYPQFKQLQTLLADGGAPAAEYRHFWDGISGATVVEVNGNGGQRLVFKEGAGQKVEDEFYKTIEWEGIAPSHTARVIGITHAKGRNGILREFAEGSLLMDLLLADSSSSAKEALALQVADVLSDIWTTTITPKPARIDYCTQIRSRMRELLRRHPKLERVAKHELQEFGGLYDLLTNLAKREAWMGPPFSIWIHGDLNADNIVVDRETKSVVFIDVHRSRYGDFLQDVSVLATSTVRRFPKGKSGKGIARANDVIFRAAETFAQANGDHHFRLRLRLARARALLTSARLEPNQERAQLLFVEGLQLLKKVAKPLKLGRVV